MVSTQTAASDGALPGVRLAVGGGLPVSGHPAMCNSIKGHVTIGDTRHFILGMENNIIEYQHNIKTSDTIERIRSRLVSGVCSLHVFRIPT